MVTTNPASMTENAGVTAIPARTRERVAAIINEIDKSLLET